MIKRILSKLDSLHFSFRYSKLFYLNTVCSLLTSNEKGLQSYNKIRYGSIVCVYLAFCLPFSLPVHGAGDVKLPPKHDWSFSGPTGTFKRDQLQRGFQVYSEVCSACHGLELIRYEKLQALGFTPEEIKAIAGQKEIPGPLNDDGEPTVVKATPADHFAKPYPNKQAARAANNGAYPPDMSLIVKARMHGADYIHALLTGYKTPPEGFEVMPGMYYNTYFAGNQIAMPPPLADGQVEYSDGTKATIDQMSEDITAFLAWTSEPELEQRRNLGIKVLIYLAFFTFLMASLMRRVWKKIKAK